MNDAEAEEFEIRMPPTAVPSPDRPSDASSPADRRAADDASDAWDDPALVDLGTDLALKMQDGDYHPVVLFGTQSSGKTHLLLSLFALLKTEPRLKTALVLCNPLLGPSGIGEGLHREAKHTFDVKTQGFIEGARASATTFDLPFFIPVEFRTDDGQPPVRFAFLESKGEWYRPKGKAGAARMTASSLFEPMRKELETFVSQFQGGISFIYLAPYTQLTDSERVGEANDAAALHEASLAIEGVIDTYDRIRVNRRADDHHLLLLTKWDEHSRKAVDRADALKPDFEVVESFCNRHYGQALTAMQRIRSQTVEAFSAGIMTEGGVIQLGVDDEARSVLQQYPQKLWSWLYGNALESTGRARARPFPEPRGPSPLTLRLRRLLDFVTGN